MRSSAGLYGAAAAAAAVLCAAEVSALAGLARSTGVFATPGSALARAPVGAAAPSDLAAAAHLSGHGRQEIEDQAAHALTKVGGGVALVGRGGGVFGRKQAPEEKPKISKKEIGIYFALWYGFNIAYNITNKNALNAINLPWTISVIQLVTGSLMVLPLWLLNLRDKPGLSGANLSELAPIGLCHMMSHTCAVIGLQAGAISFVHIVKAAEPLFTALFSAIFLRQIFSPVVYATLLPVVGGVAIACFKELEFKWVALSGAMGSNLAASSRAILSKRKMGMDMGKNMTPANMYGVLTIMASTMLLPLATLIEGPKIQRVWESAVTDEEMGYRLIFNTLVSGVFFYLYNEVAFRCLHVVHPVTHAVGNTFKRVFLIAVSIFYYHKPLTPMAAFGSAVAIGGVLLYSLVKERAAGSAMAVIAQSSRQEKQNVQH